MDKTDIIKTENWRLTGRGKYGFQRAITVGPSYTTSYNAKRRPLSEGSKTFRRNRTAFLRNTSYYSEGSKSSRITYSKNTILSKWLKSKNRAEKPGGGGHLLKLEDFGITSTGQRESKPSDHLRPVGVTSKNSSSQDNVVIDIDLNDSCHSKTYNGSSCSDEVISSLSNKTSNLLTDQSVKVSYLYQ